MTATAHISHVNKFENGTNVILVINLNEEGPITSGQLSLAILGEKEFQVGDKFEITIKEME